MRARYPDVSGVVDVDGVEIAYDVYENDAPTIVLMPTWAIIHSRHWKMQIPYLARLYRVITWDGPGNGRSSRPTDPDAYSLSNDMRYFEAVLDATSSASASVAGLSWGGVRAIVAAAMLPSLIDSVVAIAAPNLWGDPAPGRESVAQDMFAPPPDDPVGWQKHNLEYWRKDWTDFCAFFHAEVANDPHSTKLIDDLTAWSQETDGETIGTERRSELGLPDDIRDRIEAICVPTTVVSGTRDAIIPHKHAELWTEMIPGAQLHTFEGAGHAPMGRYPVQVNHIIREHLDTTYRRPPSPSTWHVGHARPTKVLMISSPIGLGHARRDVAIMQELRHQNPDISIDWLAQDPVTRVLEGAGETIHPASALLASESAHIESEAGEHDLNAFQAARNMDEILLSNFMVAEEVINQGQYDLVVGDEAWEMDYHLHENPNLKKTAYAWLTDFVGWLPMPANGDREAFVAADYNTEMIEQIARFPRVRDASIFVGQPDDIVDRSFGPDLPMIRDWTEENFDFAGYITGFDPAALGDRTELRNELGYHDDERVCIVSVGGSGVGTDLIRRVVAAYPAARGAIDDLRMIVVTGPRIDPASMPQMEGVEYRAYVDRLYRHLAVCDLAVVQGGLTTTMELAASRVPFIYVPLQNHFEQNYHVRARLERYRAGRMVTYDRTDPDNLVSAMIAELGTHADYVEVETNGAARAAEMIGRLL